ncbi:hypothetical protein Hdeb2414_s0006g00209211 [Helianthus debilis subsp. tardiflorus]
MDHGLDEGVDKDKELVIAGKKFVGKGVVVAGSSSKSLGDSFKDVAVCEDVLSHIAPPLVHGTIAEMGDDMMLSRLILSTCNLVAMLPQGVARFRKRMHEYEEFSKKKDKMKATMSTLKKENECLVKKEETLSKKVEELTQKHEVEVGELKKQVEALEASRAQLSDDNKWLTEHGFQQVVTYLLHSAEFNSVLGGVYVSFWSMGGIRVMLPVTKLASLDLKPHGLDEAVCKEVLGSLSKKRSCSGDSEDTLSCADEGSKDPSLEAFGTAVEEGKKKEKKAKKAKGDEAGASKFVLSIW